ncbi:MAG TPA: FAD-binding protein [Candidatus Dormibacteraeota bacterium]|jgi:glycerol-3-phosphate dehydrogenase subunit B|nr:FAD-binding protein [Candidatus Dormibacteraeota bacterium]
MPEVVVIGGGLAGSWAAAIAAGSGASVTLVRRAYGATATCAGPIDFVPPAEATGAASWLDRLPRSAPDHPYVAGGTAPSLAELAAGAAQLAEALAAAGLPTRVALDAPMLLAGITGQVRHASMAPETQAAGDLSRFTGRTVLVAGIAGLARFDAIAVAAALDERRIGWPAPLRARATTLTPDVPGVAPDVAADLDDATLARALEAPGGAESLGAALAGVLAGTPADVVLLPAVLGLDAPDAVATRVSQAAGGTPIAELLTSPPSAPGWRLQQACDRIAALAGVRLVAASVSSVRIEGRTAVAVELEGSGELLPCDALVLATGKYLGGGVVADPRPREPLLDLPLFSAGVPVSRLALRDLVERARFRDQPFASLGVQTDAAGAPLDEHGHTVLDNLTACGDLLAGMDPTLSGGGLGVAAWTAARAARTAARRAGSVPA